MYSNNQQKENLERIKREFEDLKRLISDTDRINGQLIHHRISVIESEIKDQEKALGVSPRLNGDWIEIKSDDDLPVCKSLDHHLIEDVVIFLAYDGGFYLASYYKSDDESEPKWIERSSSAYELSPTHYQIITLPENQNG